MSAYRGGSSDDTRRMMPRAPLPSFRSWAYANAASGVMRCAVAIAIAAMVARIEGTLLTRAVAFGATFVFTVVVMFSQSEAAARWRRARASAKAAAWMDEVDARDAADRPS